MSTLTEVMTTPEVASRLIELCLKGQILEAQEELFADDAVAIEPTGDNPVTKGKEAIIEKSKQFAAMFEAVHSSEITEPIVVGNYFTIGWMFDVTLKGQGRQKMDEICVYQVKGGKIVLEQFFYSM